jgi:hypothetical protein
LERSWAAMKEYVACFNFELALKFCRLFNAPIATSLSNLSISASLAD